MGAKVRINFTGNCGIYEIVGISGVAAPREVLRELAWFFLNVRKEEDRVPLIVFTGVTKEMTLTKGHSNGRKDNYGQAFSNYLEDNHLGDVIPSNEVLNPLSGNYIRIWIWHVDWTRVPDFVKELKDETTRH